RDHQPKGAGDVVKRGEEGEGPEPCLVLMMTRKELWLLEMQTIDVVVQPLDTAQGEELRKQMGDAYYIKCSSKTQQSFCLLMVNLRYSGVICSILKGAFTCHLSVDKFKLEVYAIHKRGKVKFETLINHHCLLAHAQDDPLSVRSKTVELQKKWRAICQRLHQNNNTSSIESECNTTTTSDSTIDIAKVFLLTSWGLLNPDIVAIEGGGCVGQEAPLFGHIYERDGEKVKFGKITIGEDGFVGSRSVAMPGVQWRPIVYNLYQMFAFRLL
ncbi:hypothetical protein Tco_0855895, partial [Tanacetum coccineum]